MELTPMRYKTYTWPHNPASYQVTWRRNVAGGGLPFQGSWMQNLGVQWRVFSGEGEFAGKGAYESFLQLAAVFQEQSAGVLAHPLWPAVRAWFVELQAEEEPLPDYVRYRFTFWEDTTATDGTLREIKTAAVPQNQGKSGAATYTVKKGDTLWGISRKYGVTLQSLIAANPQIKNPNLIYPGNRVVIP